MSYLIFLLLGLGAGALYCLLGLGLVLSYRISGVVNFAYGAVAVYTAYTFAFLMTRGDLFDPIFGLPTFIHIAHGLGLGLSLLISAAVAAVLGLLMYVLVFQFLRTAQPVTKLIASVGLMIAITAVVGLRVGTNPVDVPAIFPVHSITVGTSVLTTDRLYLAAVAIAVTVALTVVYTRTRFGKLSRAAAESEKGAILLGISPSRLSMANWVIAGVLAGMSGVLLSPILPLNPQGYTLYIIAALAAALIGRLTSFWWTAIAGLCIGMLQSEVAKFQTQWPWFPQTGVADALPFVIIIIVLAITSRALPERGAFSVRSLPLVRSVRHAVPSVGGLAVVAFAALMTISPTYRTALDASMIGFLICLSLVFLVGWAGQISFAHLAFAGCAAFALSKLTVDAGVPFPFAPLLAAAVAGLVGVVVGIPALRVRGVSLGIVTIGLAVAVEDFVFQNSSITGGFAGSHIVSPTLFGLQLGVGNGTGDSRAFSILVLIVTTLMVVAAIVIRRAAFGRAMLALRVNEKAALSVGINVTSTKIVAFGMSAFIAGMAGCMMAYQQVQISFASFDVFTAITILALAYIMGITSMSGAIVAGLLVPSGLVTTALASVVNLNNWEGLITGIALVVAVIRQPEGLVGLVAELRGRRGSGLGFVAARPPAGLGGRRAVVGEMDAPLVADVDPGVPAVGGRVRR